MSSGIDYKETLLYTNMKKLSGLELSAFVLKKNSFNNVIITNSLCRRSRPRSIHNEFIYKHTMTNSIKVLSIRVATFIFSLLLCETFVECKIIGRSNVEDAIKAG
jgi:hypothetical protein